MAAQVAIRSSEDMTVILTRPTAVLKRRVIFNVIQVRMARPIMIVVSAAGAGHDSGLRRRKHAVYMDKHWQIVDTAKTAKYECKPA